MHLFFDRQDLFNQKYVYLTDIDGSGTNDILYLGPDHVDIYFNQTGNGFSDRKPLSVFGIDNHSTIATIDLLGTGTTYLVWSSPLATDQRAPIKYIDFNAEIKSNLLIETVNNLGSETKIQYAASTKFYQQDKKRWKPWVTRLAFPVHCIESVETIDRISRNVFVRRFAYHHGYFDGFALIEEWNTQDFDTLSTNLAFDI